MSDIVKANTQLPEFSGLGLAVVAIGRNEGERLRCCLESVVDLAQLTVYVDSGSTDQSVEIAKDLGAVVVDLDTLIPFTAARARNEGYRRALAIDPSIKWIQFVDGDCEVQAGWLYKAKEYLANHEDIGAVCGRRRERYPSHSIYNEICDIEWETEPGNAKYCGGDVMMRAIALIETGGYRDSLIAGEEPELCVRLRKANWKISVLDEEMTLHDADMTKFSQWWTRVKRSGWAYAAGVHLHGGPPEHHWVWRAAQSWIWVLGPLALIVMLSLFIGTWSILALFIYLFQFARLYWKLEGNRRRRVLSAVVFTIGKFAEFSGQLRYLFDLITHRSARLIEYK